jgi:adenosylcobyric acid synthase
MELLRPGLEFLEQKTGKPVVGVIPYFQGFRIADEDSVALDTRLQRSEREDLVEIAVLRTPKISNFTDFAALEDEADVYLRYVNKGEKLGRPDLVILPGSKNTIEDLLYLREAGYACEISELAAIGVPMFGICGGYQMLGREIRDPYHTETELDSIEALGLLPVVTTFAQEKVTHQVEADGCGLGLFGKAITIGKLTGYEIHMGCTEFLEQIKHPFQITKRSGQSVVCGDGAISEDGLVLGTYIHGIFDNNDFRRELLNQLRARKGWAPLAADKMSACQRKEESYNLLADTVRQGLDMDKIYEIMDLRLPGCGQ